MHRLYLDPPVYRASQEHLGAVRLLIRRACESLLYIQKECYERGLHLDIPSINERRTLNRPPDHPYNMIASYLKPEAEERFHNYDAFSNIYTIDEEMPIEQTVPAPLVRESTETTEGSTSDSSDKSIHSSEFSLVPSFTGCSAVEVYDSEGDMDSLSAHTGWPDFPRAEPFHIIEDKAMQSMSSPPARADVM